MWSGQTDLLSCVQVHECTCSMSMVSRYQKRIPSTGPSATLRTNSGQAPVPSWTASTSTSKYPAWKAAWKPDKKLSDDRLGEPSAAIQARVEAARERQRQRFEGSSDMLTNADALA